MLKSFKSLFDLFNFIIKFYKFMYLVILNLLWVSFCVYLPILVSLLPFILNKYLHNRWYLYGLFITIPVSIFFGNKLYKSTVIGKYIIPYLKKDSYPPV
jgi:hypothetical protein